METRNITPKTTDHPAPAKQTLISSLSPAMRCALLACLFLALAFSITHLVMNYQYYGFLPTLVAGLAFIIVSLILATIMTLVLAALKRLRWQAALVIFASVFLCIPAVTALIYIMPLLVFSLVFLYLVFMLIGKRYKTLSKPKKILRYSLLGLFGVLTALTMFLTVWPGPSLKAGDRPDRAMLALPYAGQLDSTPAIDDPSLPGGYNYSVSYYAAPGQKVNPYPGQEMLSAPTVDASELLDGWSGIRKQQLGFDSDALPLNAQVWMPEGNGPFPLTLIVHGNHNSGDRSDDGYAYLGELLASRGIIAVSVDENFLNSSPLYDVFVFAQLKQENDARAFVLLEHLRQWYVWNAEPSHQFFGKVDFDNIALIGHSRGGEAVTLAAAFAGLRHYPDNGRVIFNYPFSIKTVIAIAPTHRQYDPAGLEVSLSDINYLVLHGGHDMDVSRFTGANMYSRVDVSEYGIKAKVWMQYANHSQFNVSWGRIDLPGLMNLSVNRKLLLPMEEQRQAAKVFTSAFLESTLHGKKEYNALFRDFAYGADWLPPDLYVTDYIDSGSVILDSFDSGFDIETSKSQMITYSGQGFDNWTQTELPGKGKNSNRVLLLQWGSKEYTEKYGAQTPVFKIEFAEGVVTMADRLYISLCSQKESLNEPNVSFQIKLTDSTGRASTISINDFGGVANPIDTPIGKPFFSLLFGEREPVLQMICIPTEQFEGLHGSIVSMEWIMDTVETNIDGQTLYADDLRVERSAG